MDDETEVDDETTHPSRKARPLDFVIVFLIFLSDLVIGVRDLLYGVTILAAGHANHDVDQKRFADSVRADLESIPTQSEE